MTDDEAILAMTDDNLRHRERILPTEKAQSLKMQVEAIKHQGSRPGEEVKDAGKRSTQVVGDRNSMNYKQVQRYIAASLTMIAFLWNGRPRSFPAMRNKPGTPSLVLPPSMALE